MKTLFILMMMLSSLVALETLPNKEAAQKLCESVMNDVANNKMKEGLERLRPYSIIPESEFNIQFSQLDMQMPMITQRFGKAIGYDFIEIKEAGNALMQYVYIQKFEKHAMVWRFIFYKPQDTWLLNTWYFDDKVQGLFN